MTSTETKSAIPPVSMTLRAQDPDAFATQLGDSFKRYGFAVISDHGLNADVINTALGKAKEFFALPLDVKEQYHLQDGAGQRGYVPFGQEIAKDAEHIDLKEFWHVGRDLPDGHKHSDIMAPNLDVTEIANWPVSTYAMYEEMEALGKKVLSSIARYLNVDDAWFEDAVQDGNSILRLLHYPAQETPPPEGSVRAAAHGDINVITLLLGAEEGGLEVKDRDGRWLPISPPPDCIVINVGDMLERLTNHVLPSTQHRVVNPKPERSKFARYSTPYFLHFRPDFVVETLETCITDDNPNQYPTPITAHEFLLQRLRDINLI